MRTMARWAGWSVFGVVAWVICCNVVSAYGQQSGFAIVGLCSGAAWVLTDRAQLFLGWLRDAITDITSEKAAAIDMGISKGQLSEALSGAEQLSFSRATDLPDAVWEAFATRVLNASGRYVVLERGIVADLVLANQGLHETLKQMAEPPRPQLAFSARKEEVA